MTDLERRVGLALGGMVGGALVSPHDVGALAPPFGVAAGGSPSRLVRGLALYIEELRRWNAVMNLTASGEIDAIIAHIVDSLSICSLLEERMREGGRGMFEGRQDGARGMPEGRQDGARFRVIDVGSGNGLPAIPLALYAPACHFVLVEPHQKRCAFLESVVAILRLENCVVMRARLEAVAQAMGQGTRESARRAAEQGEREGTGLTERYDLALTRALPKWSASTVAHFASLLHADGMLIVYARPHSDRAQRIAALVRQRFSHVRVASAVSPAAASAAVSPAAAPDGASPAAATPAPASERVSARSCSFILASRPVGA